MLDGLVPEEIRHRRASRRMQDLDDVFARELLERRDQRRFVHRAEAVLEVGDGEIADLGKRLDDPAQVAFEADPLSVEVVRLDVVGRGARIDANAIRRPYLSVFQYRVDLEGGNDPLALL